MCDKLKPLDVLDGASNHGYAEDNHYETSSLPHGSTYDASAGDSINEDQDPLGAFASVLKTIRLDRLPAFATQVRRLLAEHSQSTNSPSIETATVASPLLSGSYHVLFPIDFSDGARWILKVPGLGTIGKWGPAAARSLTSEALTMRLLCRETTIPVPQIFEFSADLHDEIGVPFILMEWIDGCSLDEVWFDIAITEADLQSRRTQTLRDVASAMTQLSNFIFQCGGSIVFGADGAPSEVGPMRVVDSHAMIARLDADDDDEDDSPIYAEVGPFQDYRSYYAAGLARWPEPRVDWQKGDLALLKLFLDWIPEFDDSMGASFVLTHPDFDIQNILVSKDGHVKAIIDWDGVCAVPRTVGSERYPSWLTRDWDPTMYNYQSGMETGSNFEGCREDSPEKFAFYRNVYAGLIAQSDSQVENVTRQSLIFENLLIAADDPLCTHGILVNLFDKIKQVLNEGQTQGLGYWELTQNIAQGKADQRVVDILHGGFNALLAGHKGLI
ncbi:hypothetical protein FH972_023969 [Carpinus fangiana]|uniref:Aminoglycoside phosphotransferase domain-containing protein n=1 Tax=Carpinus fangiana TaxID=176857 RepID=A0A5N6KWZ9_9ROSI|nr:hypothetical protein FH972_023969 [Carpinus fangiana]